MSQSRLEKQAFQGKFRIIDTEEMIKEYLKTIESQSRLEKQAFQVVTRHQSLVDLLREMGILKDDNVSRNPA